MCKSILYFLKMGGSLMVQPVISKIFIVYDEDVKYNMIHLVMAPKGGTTRCIVLPFTWNNEYDIGEYWTGLDWPLIVT